MQSTEHISQTKDDISSYTNKEPTELMNKHRAKIDYTRWQPIALSGLVQLRKQGDIVLEIIAQDDLARQILNQKVEKYQLWEV